MGGESIYGEAFEDEFSDKLFNLKGALSMANAAQIQTVVSSLSFKATKCPII